MARKPQENPALDMTPMIDVVFELIIFFVVTIKQEDVFSKLNANRPAPASGQSSNESDTTVTIEIGRGPDANGIQKLIKQLNIYFTFFEEIIQGF